MRAALEADRSSPGSPKGSQANGSGRDPMCEIWTLGNGGRPSASYFDLKNSG
jgi:hypothetical protein